MGLLLAACQPTRPPTLDLVAGQPPFEFGMAVRNNEIVNRGGSPIVALQVRFANEVPAAVTFPFDSAALDPLARLALDRQAAWMRQFPEVRFSVLGHADAVGASPYNEALGRRRAQAVVAHLASRGVSPSRLDALVSFGEARPAVPGAGPERLNRRVVTRVSDFVARHPTVLEGDFAAVLAREYVASGAPAPRIGAATGMGGAQE
jgi:outer membrane protein OmpA-like peptidoglycan-associated protein